MKRETVEVKKFSEEMLQKCLLPVIAIYNRPDDYPQNAVARLYNLEDATPYAIIGQSVEEVRKAMPEWMTRLPRYANDVPCLVETWL